MNVFIEIRIPQETLLFHDKTDERCRFEGREK